MSQELNVILGGGALGRGIARHLIQKGKRARMVSRRAEWLFGEPIAGAELFKADITNFDEARKACEGATVVYHTATPDYTQWPTLYPPIQAGAIEGAAATNAVLVSAESVYMYGPVNVPMTEELPHVASTRKGKVRAQLAKMLMDAHEKGKVRVAIARAPDFYGPESLATTIYGDRVFYPALAGKKVSVMGKLDSPHTFIYGDDFSRGMIALGESSQSLGQAWHLPCPPTLTQRQMLELIFKETGKPIHVGETPSLVFKMMSPFVPIMKELSEMLYQWEHPYYFDSSKFQKAFGDFKVTPHEQGIKETVEWYRRHPAK